MYGIIKAEATTGIQTRIINVETTLMFPPVIFEIVELETIW